MAADIKTTLVKYFKKAKKNIYVRNLVLALIIFFAIIFLSSYFLDAITRHGKTRPVPDFKDKIIVDAEKLAKENGLKIVVSDSIFLSTKPAGAVLEQNPKAETHVKSGRTIYLTINCVTPQKVEVPNVVGFSLRQAKAVLSSKGIHVGRLTYKEDMAMNNVIGQRCRDVETGAFVSNDDNRKAMVYFGDEIELIVGLGNNPDERYSYVPKLIGRSAIEAKSLLTESYLNIGKISYDSSVKSDEDKRASVVKSQSKGENTRRSLGESVDIVLGLKTK